jgi:predicted enzyme related to lactoylglutathione lyase
LVQHVFAGVAVADYASALPWYERLFGRQPDVIVKGDEAMWRVTDTGWVYVHGDSSRAGQTVLTLLVENLEDRVAQLAGRGIATSAIETVPGLYRKTLITDPEGNTITLGEAEHQSTG